MGYLHGADGGLMRMKVQEELDKELRVQEGGTVRKVIEFAEAIPPSDLHLDVDFDKLEDDENIKD